MKKYICHLTNFHGHMCNLPIHASRKGLGASQLFILDFTFKGFKGWDHMMCTGFLLSSFTWLISLLIHLSLFMTVLVLFIIQLSFHFVTYEFMCLLNDRHWSFPRFGILQIMF